MCRVQFYYGSLKLLRKNLSALHMHLLVVVEYYKTCIAQHILGVHRQEYCCFYVAVVTHTRVGLLNAMKSEILQQCLTNI